MLLERIVSISFKLPANNRQESMIRFNTVNIITSITNWNSFARITHTIVKHDVLYVQLNLYYASYVDHYTW